MSEQKVNTSYEEPRKVSNWSSILTMIGQVFLIIPDIVLIWSMLSVISSFTHFFLPIEDAYKVNNSYTIRNTRVVFLEIQRISPLLIFLKI